MTPYLITHRGSDRLKFEKSVDKFIVDLWR